MFHFALTHLSEPVSLTATSDRKMCRGLPSALPRCSVEMSSGPAILLPVHVAFTSFGGLSPPRWYTNCTTRLSLPTYRSHVSPGVKPPSDGYFTDTSLAEPWPSGSFFMP